MAERQRSRPHLFVGAGAEVPAPARQFLISQAVALGIADAMHDCGIRARIKWTNDIYAGERKLTGILIEHKLSGGAIDRSIIGIGLNVNSTQFDPALPNPVSMALLAGRTFDRAQVLEQLRTRIAERYEALRRGETEALQRDYHRSLYRLDEQHTYALPDGSRLRGTIRGVEESGALRVEHADGRVKSYLFKEIEFILKN